jgi:hypothetical protein
MLSLIIAAALASAFAIPDQTKGEGMTVADLRLVCGTSEPQVPPACKFYILGASEGLALAGSTEGKAAGQFVARTQGRHFCIPDNLPTETIRQKIMAMMDADLRAYPDDAKQPAISFVAAVIEQSYPCP